MSLPVRKGSHFDQFLFLLRCFRFAISFCCFVDEPKVFGGSHRTGHRSQNSFFEPAGPKARQLWRLVQHSSADALVIH